MNDARITQAYWRLQFLSGELPCSVQPLLSKPRDFWTADDAKLVDHLFRPVIWVVRPGPHVVNVHRDGQTQTFLSFRFPPAWLHELHAHPSWHMTALLNEAMLQMNTPVKLGELEECADVDGRCVYVYPVLGIYSHSSQSYETPTHRNDGHVAALIKLNDEVYRRLSTWRPLCPQLNFLASVAASTQD